LSDIKTCAAALSHPPCPSHPDRGGCQRFL